MTMTDRLWQTFDCDRAELDRQYEAPAYRDGSGLTYDELEKGALALAEELAGEPHPVVKARAFAYILEHTRLAVNPRDWFGFHFDVLKVVGKADIGWHVQMLLRRLSSKWIKELCEGPVQPYVSERARQGRDDGLFVMYPDYAHSSPNWDDLLALGLPGLLARARHFRREQTELTPVQAAFYDGIEITYTAVISFAERLAAEVSLHAAGNAKMQRLAAALRHLAVAAPASTYEALVLAMLYWKLQENVEMARVRTLGDMGVQYYDFYQRDLASGRGTREQIKELFKYFLNHFAAMHVVYQQPMYFGSMDAAGQVQITELSRLIFDAYDECGLYDPKLQVCIAESTPDDFIKRVLDAIRGGNSSISLINSENAIASLLKCGMSLADARNFVMTGCWDYAVRNEAKTIPLRLNLPKVVELTLNNGIDPLSGHRLGPATGDAESFDSFAAFYAAFKRQLADIAQYMMSVANCFEAYLHEFNPTPLYSATIVEGLLRGADAFAGGAKVSSTVFNVSCLATTVDSLAAVKKFVYDRAEISLPALAAALRQDWQGAEVLRARILADHDKYGNGSALADGLMVDLTNYTTSLINNKPNSRGGFYKQGQITIDFNVKFGTKTGATPDGRRCGEPHSKNLSATVGMDRQGLTGLINSVTKMDMSNFNHAGMLDFILHPSAVQGDEGLDIMLALVRTYFRKGGHSIQGNVFDAQLLRDAQAHPERYATLQVRVCGWNVYFVNLSRKEQDMFIAQAEHLERLEAH